MGEVAEMFDVTPALIRFWESKFDILKLQRNRKGNRLFTPEDVDHFKLIYHLVKERGMTLEGAEKRIRQNKTGALRDLEVIDHLQHIRAILAEIREELRDDPEGVTTIVVKGGKDAPLGPDERELAEKNPPSEPAEQRAAADYETPVAPAPQPEPAAENIPRFIEQTLF